MVWKLTRYTTGGKLLSDMKFGDGEYTTKLLHCWCHVKESEYAIATADHMNQHFNCMLPILLHVALHPLPKPV